jgi:hypothetical protein
MSKSMHFGGDSVNVTGAGVTGVPPSTLCLYEGELGALVGAERDGPACCEAD